MTFILLLLLFLIAFANLYLLAKIEKFCCSIPWIIYGFWTIQIFLVRFLLFSEQWYDWGLVFIQFSILLFSISYIIGQYGFVRRKVLLRPVNSYKDGKIHNLIIEFLFVIGMFSVLVFLKEHNVSISSFREKGLLKINSEMAHQRYYENIEKSTFSAILSIIPNCLVLYTGIVQGIYGIRWRYTFMSFFPVLLTLLITNTKSGLIANVIFFIASYCIGYLVRNRKPFTLTKKTFLIIVLSGFSIVLILFFAMVLRLGALNKENIIIVREKFSSYALGHIVAFDQWFGEKPKIYEYTFGRYTFYSIFDQLGISKREQGVYQELIEHAGIRTNVYTIYRGFISDFTCMGTLIICVLLGFISGRIIRQIKKNKITESKVLFLVFVQILFCYYIVSVLSYTTYLCMFVLFYCLLLSTNLLRGKNHWFKIIKYNGFTS